MNRNQIEATLDACEEALAHDEKVDLRALGFWRAVAAVKRRPEWIDRYADRIGAIDREAFERAVQPVFTVPVGLTALALATIGGVLAAAATFFVPRKWKAATLLTGAVALVGATHDLAHFVVGWLESMRFVGWFFDGPLRVQPGLKIDYATYLRTPPRERAWMHASGAIVTKIVPFALIGVGMAAGAPRWTRWLLAVVGMGQLVTDLLFSTQHGDWARFSREIRVAPAVGVLSTERSSEGTE